MFRLILKKPKGPDIDTDLQITCFWKSCGTWGSYRPPNKIFICPWEIPDLKQTIEHEIAHLKYFNQTKKMNYNQREKYINSKT